jgi:hypothetical protein
MGDQPANATTPLRRRVTVSFAVLAVLSAFASAPVSAQEAEHLTVKLGNETIREVAQKYLGDPDLWAEIVRASGLKSVTDLRAGLDLKIPATTISTANKALVDANGQIRNANQAGAQVFAHDNIVKAIALHDQALTRRSKSDWSGTRTLATESYGEATVALEKSLAARDRAAEALVTDRHGNVEGQRPQDLGWRGLQLQSTLIEEEKVRTLSDSTAQITFQDASRLRLNANSNAIIQRLRYDPLKRSEEAKVSLVEGDFYALLSSSSTRASFNVEVPSVNANIESGNFWVRNDNAGAKFTNYDDGAVEVAAAGGRVTLGRNEGTIVRPGAAPREAIAVLPPPALAGPANDAIAFNQPPRLAWQPMPEAVGYWIEIGGDQAFARMVTSRFGIETAQFEPGTLPPGEYFWRVAALDQFGLPGARSAVWRFVLTVDKEPPFLTVRTPERDSIFRVASVSVSGEAEPGARVTVQGADARPAPDGRFRLAIEARAGLNKIEIVAIDPAGNETRQSRSFVFMPDAQSTVSFDATIPSVGPKHFLSAVETISLGGRTTPDARIEIKSGAAVAASAATDKAGDFRLNLPLRAGTQAFEAVVTTSSGFASSETFSVTVDAAAPRIQLDAPPPRLTVKPALALRGRTKPGARLLLNGREIANRNGSFEDNVELKPGVNVIELSASDAAGNVTVEKWQTQFDGTPPAFVRSRVVPAPGGRPTLVIEVEAEDASGLAAVAPFKVTAGGRTLGGHLRFNRAVNLYQGTIAVPDAALADAKLSEIELIDDAGNRQTLTFN